MSTDRIEKKIVLKAPRARVWDAISDFRRFGIWFGAALDGPFVAGQWVSGRIAPTEVDPEVAKMQEPFAGAPMHLLVETIEPMTRLAFRWHPYAPDSGRDYTKEPTTLVTFTLGDVEGGTLLTITETGFDRLPPDRRDEAFKGNAEGWEHQTRLVEKYLARGA
ncbi:MAG TPA: SRPBCC family protein [Reyranella sp.]|nr:SRPBCC family protein [Reyranella sp.]